MTHHRGSGLLQARVLAASFVGTMCEEMLIQKFVNAELKRIVVLMTKVRTITPTLLFVLSLAPTRA